MIRVFQVSESAVAARSIRYYTYRALEAATGNFNRRKRKDGGALIAGGSFGEVFYGVLEGQRIAAVKRLKGVLHSVVRFVCHRRHG